MTDAIVRTRALTKSYGRQRGIEDVDLDVQRGEVFGFLGPNGAGKTTAIRVLLDLLRPTRGKAEIFGLDSHEASARTRERIGYLPGDLALYEKLTGREMIRYSANLRGGVDWGRVDALAVRLKSDLSKPIHALSRGNKQKIGLILAFMHEPELLVLDEPTSGLDPLMQQEFNALVREARRDGRTVFLSSHVLPEVESVCDRVAIIREGRVVAVEDVHALKRRAVRRVEVRFARPVSAEAFAGVPGVRDVTATGATVTGAIAGTLDAFVKAIAEHEVEDVITHEPHLEDVFLTYYSEGDRRAA